MAEGANPASQPESERNHAEKALDSHPRRESLLIRERLVEGVRSGITSQHGLIAHGRGEAFDYLIGERTHDFAETAIRAAVAMLLLAERPIISVNGNAAALVPKDLVRLSEVTAAPLEINLFHHSEKRVSAIEQHLEKFGGTSILKPTKDAVISTLSSDRKYVNTEGIAVADVIFVPLEDGDRCGALQGAGKSVITVDLNPLSRTSRDASITIVDNIVRAMPRMVERATETRRMENDSGILADLESYDHAAILQAAEKALRAGL